MDLFASDEEEDDEAQKLKEERLKAYQAKKSKKPSKLHCVRFKISTFNSIFES